MKKRIQRKQSNCAVVKGEIDLSKYEKLDGEWKELGLASPARRALINAKLLKLMDLKKISEAELINMHGIGPNALKKIQVAMRKNGLIFKK